MKKSKNQKTILRGSSNQHTLHGDFSVESDKTEFGKIVVNKDSVLRHEQPDGSFGEHNTLKVEQGEWVMGKQVEYNPFKRTVSQVWD